MSITKKWKVTEIVDGKLIATASTLHVGAINAEADARAIAEVPAMIVVLKSALKTIVFEKHPFRQWHDEARAILKRSEG